MAFFNTDIVQAWNPSLAALKIMQYRHVFNGQHISHATSEVLACPGSNFIALLNCPNYSRLANDAKVKGKERQFNGLIDVYTKTFKSDGIQGLYRGFTISCVGIFIYRGMYFGLYDSLKPILLGEENASVALSFLLGWGVTITAGLMSYPIDTIR